MTATIILQLVQEGLLTLDDPVSTFVPNVPDGNNITVAQLLEMRSGLYSYTNDPTFVRESDADLTRPWTPDELLDLAFAHPAEFPPGSTFQYSNTNYILLGKIMETLTGQTAQELFEQRLFTPLSSPEATTMPGPEDTTPATPFLHGYHYGSFDKPLPDDQQAKAAAGTLLPVDQSTLNPSWAWTAPRDRWISTAADMLIWTEALVDGTLLDPAMQQVRMDSIQSLGPDFPTAEGKYWYGYGIDRRVTYDGHGGQINGYNSAVARDPPTDTHIVVLTTLTLAPDGTSVANALAYSVINGITDTDTDVDVPLQTGEGGRFLRRVSPSDPKHGSVAPGLRRRFMEAKLELVLIPVADVDRAKAIYIDRLGFVEDVDVTPAAGVRVVQVTLVGSACLIGMGTGLPAYDEMPSRAP